MASSSAKDPSLGLGALWREFEADGAEVTPPFSVDPFGKVLEVSSCHEAGGPWDSAGAGLTPVRLGRSHRPGAPPPVGPFQQLPRPLHQAVNSGQGGQPS